MQGPASPPRAGAREEATGPPPGFEARSERDLRVWSLSGYADAALLLTEGARGSGAGRGRVRFCAIPGSPAGERAAIRHYFRGGILAPLLGDHHLDRDRPLREIRLYLAARAAGVPTIEPLAGVARRVAGPFWRCDLLTRAVEGARDLGQLMPELARACPRRRSPVVAAAARAVRALHDAGFDHRDLNLKNVLVRDPEKEEPRALVIDLDGARLRPGPLGAAERRQNLLRLYRSSQKLARRAGCDPPSRSTLLRFVREYCGADRALFVRLARGRLPTLALRRLLWAALG